MRHKFKKMNLSLHLMKLLILLLFIIIIIIITITYYNQLIIIPLHYNIIIGKYIYPF